MLGCIYTIATLSVTRLFEFLVYIVQILVFMTGRSCNFSHTNTSFYGWIGRANLVMLIILVSMAGKVMQF